MSIALIQARLDSYNCRTDLEEEMALREITQEVVLAALGRGDFFKHALFHGGTCLRIFYSLNRFSEDMDFTLRVPDPGFDLISHLDSIREELTAQGYDIEIQDRSKADRAVKGAFIKDDSLGRLITLNYAGRTGPLRKIRIKFEIDTNPPAGAQGELKYLDFPFVSSVAVEDVPSLFAGKIHALLCREYIKGRDWYDFIWYTARKAAVNYAYLQAALEQTGPWKGTGLAADQAWVVKELEGRILGMDWKKTADDARGFVNTREQVSLALWNKDLFLGQLAKWSLKA